MTYGTLLSAASRAVFGCAVSDFIVGAELRQTMLDRNIPFACEEIMSHFILRAQVYVDNGIEPNKH